MIDVLCGPDRGRWRGDRVLMDECSEQIGKQFFLPYALDLIMATDSEEFQILVILQVKLIDDGSKKNHAKKREIMHRADI